MSSDDIFPKVGTIVAGYLLSAAAAAVTVAFILSAVLRGPTNVFVFFLVGGLVYSVFLGLPGFAVIIFIARGWLIRHWAYFTLAGGLNAILAWTLVGGLNSPFWNSGGSLMMLASVAGGFVGGFAYWFAVEHRGRDEQRPATRE